MCLAPILGLTQAIASPPFVLDDGEVQGLGNVEIDVGPLATFDRGESSGSLPYLETDLGVLRGVEADVIAPIAFTTSTGRGVAVGPADLELEAKAHVVDQGSSSALPSIALGPTLLLPTGSAKRDLGQGRPQIFLPIWFSKSVGRWTIFGGGGPMIGHGPEERDFILVGAGVDRTFNDAWHVGFEAYETTCSGKRSPSRLSADLDVVRYLSPHVHLFASVGRAVGAGLGSGQASVFAGVQVTE